MHNYCSPQTYKDIKCPCICNSFHRLTDKVGAKSLRLSEEQKNLLQRVSSLYFDRGNGEDMDGSNDFKTIKGTHI